MVKRRYPNLKAFLADTGRTQSEFADRLGITQHYLSKIVNGRQRPSLPLALKIAAAAQVPVASLMPAKRSAA